MTRCLDCGAVRTSDECPVCGLTSAAAELVFRRRLLLQMAIFLSGSLLFPYVSQIYAPLDLDAMLVFFGLVFFLALTLAVFLERRAHAHQEIEVLLRWTSSPHSTTGYECFARCANDDSSYLQIVRWNGPLGNFTYLADMRGADYGLKNGDILKASVIGSVITVYVNGF